MLNTLLFVGSGAVVSGDPDKNEGWIGLEILLIMAIIVIVIIAIACLIKFQMKYQTRNIVLFSLLVAVVSFLVVIAVYSGMQSDPSGNSESNAEKPESGFSDLLFDTVEFDTNGGSFVAPITTNKLYKAPNTTKDGYILDGWFKDVTLTQAVVFPLEVEDDITIYAKWVKVSDTKYLNDCDIKFLDSGHDSIVTYSITPVAFDYDRLEAHGYTKMQITVTYTVHYKKDYDVLWDVGYAGSPKYEIYISNSDGWGNFESDLNTYTREVTETITVCTYFDSFEKTPIVLGFSTDNIQNIIYFTDIKVEYKCGT